MPSLDWCAKVLWYRMFFEMSFYDLKLFSFFMLVHFVLKCDVWSFVNRQKLGFIKFVLGESSLPRFPPVGRAACDDSWLLCGLDCGVCALSSSVQFNSVQFKVSACIFVPSAFFSATSVLSGESWTGRMIFGIRHLVVLSMASSPSVRASSDSESKSLLAPK